MSEEDVIARRVRFYGVGDLAAGWFVPRVAELAEQFDPAEVLTNAEDAIELHNVRQYLEHGFFPASYSEEDRTRASAKVSLIDSAVARFFSTVNDANFAATVAGVRHDYHPDLIELLGRHKAFERCSGGTVIPSLAAAGVHLGKLLKNKRLVQAYDAELREELCASPRGAELLVQHFLQKDTRGQTHLPRSFSASDARKLLERYIDDEDANLNYVRLIASAKENRQAGVDAKLKLRAKRRADELNSVIFRENAGFKTGCEVLVSEEQVEPLVFELDESDGLVSRYSYSRAWLEATLDSASILNNFLHLFGFADRHALLTLPSYPSQLSVFERFMGTTGKTEYKTGIAFQAADMSSLLQTHMYNSFLDSKDIELEQAIAWFFEECLVAEFGAPNFSFTPSGAGASPLQKVRHLFAEMESVANQFALFVENGEVDRDLLTMASDQVRYRDIASLLQGKYIYPEAASEMAGILNLLFSDQSHLGYISENLNASNAATLLVENRVAYDDFGEHHRPSIDHLIELGVLENTGTRVRVASVEQFRILNSLFTTQAASYYHLTPAGRAEADAMAARGWVTRRSSLLTDAEADYFNYFLNAVDFSNGPQLRNKYLHGVQANGEGEVAHFNTYVTALRLIIALVIKINDDFCLATRESSADPG